MHSVTDMGVSNLPAFLTKIWTLVEDPSTDEFIAWDSSGTSFHVFDQTRFAKEILPLYFKHNNMVSFIRQLNMYGFRKVVHVDNGSMKHEKDDVEFFHTYFHRDREDLLDNIKRKQSSLTSPKSEPGLKLNPEDVSRVLSDVHHMKGKQENISGKMDNLKKENEALWREVATLRQKHNKQQQVVNKLIQFMIHLVGGNRGLANNMKRKMPLMINDASQVSNKEPKYSKQLSIEELPEAYMIDAGSPSSYLEQSPISSGPIISEVTDLLTQPTDILQSVPIAGSADLPQTSMPISNVQPNYTSQNTDNIHTNLSSLNTTGVGSTDLLNSTLDSCELQQLVDYSMLPSGASTASTEETSGQLDRLFNDIPKGQTPTIALPAELTGHLDNMQEDLDFLKDILSNTQYSIDTSSLFDILNAEEKEKEDIAAIGMSSKVGRTATTTAPSSNPGPGVISGNELVSFSNFPNDLLLSPLGFPDLSDMATAETDLNTEPIISDGDISDSISHEYRTSLLGDDLHLD